MQKVIIGTALLFLMIKKILISFVFLVLILTSGCVQNSTNNPPIYTNAVEENISKILSTDITSKEDIWNALSKENIPEKIGYRPATEKVWIIAEIDTKNNTWIAIDIDSKKIIRETAENKQYFSGIFFNNLEEYQQKLVQESYTPSSFQPIHKTTMITTLTISASPTDTPHNPTNIQQIDINSIFLEALIGFIIGFITLWLIDVDVPEVIGALFVGILMIGAVFSIISHPTTDITTASITIQNFVITWVFECVKISLGGAFGALFGAIVKAISNPFNHY